METVQGYILTRLDEMQGMLREILAMQSELRQLSEALPVAPVAETAAAEAPHFLSRLQNLLPLLQPLGKMAVKHAITVLMVWYMIKQDGNAFAAAELLLKLL